MGAAQLAQMDFIPVYNLVPLPFVPQLFKKATHSALNKNIIKAFSLEVQWAQGMWECRNPRWGQTLQYLPASWQPETELSGCRRELLGAGQVYLCKLLPLNT